MRLPAYKRGCHVVTRKVLEQLPELCEYEVGMANFFSTPPILAPVTGSSPLYMSEKLGAYEARAALTLQTTVNQPRA